jgi:hypothetical protein
MGYRSGFIILVPCERRDGTEYLPFVNPKQCMGLKIGFFNVNLIGGRSGCLPPWGLYVF